jgi:tripartite-type tricarboxylate transporter receptor subunit TctC
MLRRHALLALAMPATLPAWAQGFPERPLRMIVGYPAGGANDLVARAVAQPLGEALGQNVVVENRTGAAGAIGAEAAARAAPDGHTLYMMSSAQVLAMSLRRQLPYDAVRDFAAIALAARGPYLLIVHPSVPARSLAEFVALAKARPGRMGYASSGIGAGPHLTSAWFYSLAGIELNHVPYRGDADLLPDLLAGRVDATFVSLAPTMAYVQGGQLRALAISGAERSPMLPAIPTVAESGFPGFEMDAWWGLVAPAATPAPILARIEQAALPIIRSQAFADRFASQGIVPGRLGATDFARLIANDRTRFEDIVRRAGIERE